VHPLYLNPLTKLPSRLILAFDSEMTKRYMRVREGTMLDVFEKIAKRG